MNTGKMKDMQNFETNWDFKYHKYNNQTVSVIDVFESYTVRFVTAEMCN